MQNTEQFLKDFSNAWATQDTSIILDAVNEDFQFRMANCEEAVKGKAAFADWLKNMDCGDGKATITHDKVVINGEQAAITGEITVTGTKPEQRFAFCDIYTLTNNKISTLTAYCVKFGEGMGCE